MADKKDKESKKDEGAAAAEATETFETYYDDSEEGGSCWSMKDPMKGVCDTMGTVHNGMLKFLPTDVVEHLGNAQKEFLRAGVALAESRMRSIDKTVQHRRDQDHPEAEA